MHQKAKSAAHRPWTRRFTSFLGTPLFFWLTVLLFVLQAGWIALSARYPQAFDEQFHFGIIQLYGHHLSPFWTHQPASIGTFGAITRDPSYLYQYLMSFPYRLLAHFTSDLTIQIISLRFINIALMAGGLYVFRRVLRYTSASEALINTTLFFFALTPVVPLLASQINYDNLVIPVTGLAVWWYLRFWRHLRVDKVWRWDIIGQLAIICLLASLVKYAFLPIFAALVLMICYQWMRFRKNVAWHKVSSKIKLFGYGLLLILSLGLFLERYGINTVRYHTPTPECNQVLSVQACEAYAPWARNYSIVQNKVMPPWWQVATYPFDWLYHSMGELVFTIGSAFNSSGTVDYFVGTQLIVMEVLSWAIFGVGAILCIAYAKWLWRQEVLRLFIVVIAFYIAALGGQNYLDYLHTGQPVAIHGRYLLPILLFIYIIVALVFRKVLDRIHISGTSATGRKSILTAVVMCLLLFEGGGFVTYIMRNDPRWLWPQSNCTARECER